MPKRSIACGKKWGKTWLFHVAVELFASDIHTAIKINAAIPEEVRLHSHRSPSLIEIKDRTAVQSQQKYQTQILLTNFMWYLPDILSGLLFRKHQHIRFDKSIRPSHRAYEPWWLSKNHPLRIHLSIHHHTSIYIPCFWKRGLVLYQRGSDCTKELNINRLRLQLFLPFVPATWDPKDAQD